MDNWAETLEAPEQGATYVVAMDYNFPCPFTNPAEVAAGANRQDLQRRTLFQIYKLKPGKQWQPANDMGNIKLVVGKQRKRTNRSLLFRPTTPR